MSNAVKLREEDLRSVLFNFEEALEKIGLLKDELPKIESKLKEILEDSKEMVTLDEFSKKNFKSICVEDVSYCLNACVGEAYFNISYFGGQLFE